MARMIPSTIHSSVRSGAERRLFKAIRDSPGTESWVVLHSLALAKHESKRRGEIDFLFLTPRKKDLRTIAMSLTILTVFLIFRPTISFRIRTVKSG